MNNSSSQQSLSQYHPDAQASIKAGLDSGHVRFEPSNTGGEYIFSKDKSFGASKAAPTPKSSTVRSARPSRTPTSVASVGGGADYPGKPNLIRGDVGDFPTSRMGRASRIA